MAWTTELQEENGGRAGFVSKAAQRITRRSPFLGKRHPPGNSTVSAGLDDDEDDNIAGVVLGEGTPPILPPGGDDMLMADLDEIPMEESNMMVLTSLPGLRRPESADDSVCWDEAGDGSNFGDDALDEPPRMPRLPFASRLIAGHSDSFEERDWPEEQPEEHDVRVFTPRIGVTPPAHQDARMAGRLAVSNSPVHSPRGLSGRLCNSAQFRGTIRLDELERSIQKVDFSRLEARLRCADGGCSPAPPPPPPSARLALDGNPVSGGPRFASDREPEDGLVDANKIPNIFDLDSFDEAGDEEEHTLVDTSKAVCGGGCRFVKLSNGSPDVPWPTAAPNSSQFGLDDDIAGGLQDFLDGADDDALDYILRPLSARGQSPFLGMPTAL